MRHPALVPLAVLAAVTTSGCDSNDGPNPPGTGGVDTHDMRFAASVEAGDDAKAKVTVQLNVWPSPIRGGTPNFVLSNGDELRACVGAQCTSVTRDPSFLGHTAELPYVAEGIYTISFSRTTGAGAPSSFVTMPAFAILAPPAGLAVTDGQMVTVQWAPPNDNGRATVESHTHCDHEGGAESDREAIVLIFTPAAGRPDTGSAIVSVDEMVAGDWVVRPPLPRAPVRRCDIVLEVRQTRSGTVDTAWGSGSLGGALGRSVTLDYTP